MLLFSSTWAEYLQKFTFLISEGIVATCLRWDGRCRMRFVANFMRFPAVQKVWESVKIWQSYREFKGENVFETPCIAATISAYLVTVWNSIAVHKWNTWLIKAEFGVWRRSPAITGQTDATGERRLMCPDLFGFLSSLFCCCFAWI